MTALRTLGTLVLGFAAAMPAAAQTVTTQRDDYASSSGARGIAVADLNRDGWLDIITAHNDPDGLVIETNRGASGGFDKWFISLGAGPFDVAAADLDKDGIADLAVADADGNKIVLLFGVSGGGFQVTAVDAPGNPRGVTIADIDRDGNPDVIYTAYQMAGVQVLYGDGAEHFTARTGPLAVGANPQGVASADFNMDGWPDLAVAAAGTIGLSILYQRPTAPGTFTRADLNAPGNQNVVTVADLNRDGRPDVAAASTGNSTVTVFLNGRASTETLVYPSGGGSPRGIAAADLNRDGAPEIVTGNRGTSTIEILPNGGDGHFGAAYGFAAGSGARTVAIADFNNDGRLDIASGNEYASTATVLSNTTSFTQSAYAFHHTTLGGSSSTYGPSMVAVADFDLDGRMDVATAGANSDAVVLLANGASTHLATLPGGPWTLVAADFNGDGKSDVAIVDVTRDYHAQIETYLGDGTGAFPAHKSLLTSMSASSNFQIADINRDGKPDAVLAGTIGTASTAQGVFQVLLGNGDGSFRLGATIAAPRDSWTFRLGDVDRDGDVDIVSHINAWANNGISAAVTYVNDGTGGFSSSTRTAPVSQWSYLDWLDLADVNHDGYVDLIAAGYNGDYTGKNGLAVLLGSASGFQTPSYFDNVAGYPQPLTMADMTLDGNPDIVMQDGDIYPGRGDGSFGPASRFDFAAPTLVVADFNKDGLPDIVAPERLGVVQVLLNQHDDTNHAPAVDAGRDFTVSYEYQYGEGDWELWAQGADPDLHRLTYTWFDGDGNLLQAASTYQGYTPRDLLPGTHTFVVEVNDGRGATARDSVNITVTPLKEIVIYTAQQYPYSVGDKWGTVADSTAASGWTLHDRNDGAAKVTAPLASPSSYTELYFVADPTQTYKLWVRLKADSNSWANDSLYLQFSNTDFAPGTTSGIAVNLEECSGCGESGWGWRDEAWGSKDIVGTLTLKFTKGGGQTLRIQTREDGVSVDQIVLSSEKYLTTRPGTVKNDATILTWTPFY